jgi:hypothetical protein
LDRLIAASTTQSNSPPSGFLLGGLFSFVAASHKGSLKKVESQFAMFAALEPLGARKDRPDCSSGRLSGGHRKTPVLKGVFEHEHQNSHQRGNHRPH